MTRQRSHCTWWYSRYTLFSVDRDFCRPNYDRNTKELFFLDMQRYGGRKAVWTPIKTRQDALNNNTGIVVFISVACGESGHLALGGNSTSVTGSFLSRTKHNSDEIMSQTNGVRRGQSKHQHILSVSIIFYSFEMFSCNYQQRHWPPYSASRFFFVCVFSLLFQTGFTVTMVKMVWVIPGIAQIILPVLHII